MAQVTQVSVQSCVQWTRGLTSGPRVFLISHVCWTLRPTITRFEEFRCISCLHMSQGYYGMPVDQRDNSSDKYHLYRACDGHSELRTSPNPFNHLWRESLLLISQRRLGLNITWLLVTDPRFHQPSSSSQLSLTGCSAVSGGPSIPSSATRAGAGVVLVYSS